MLLNSVEAVEGCIAAQNHTNKNTVARGGGGGGDVQIWP